MNRIGVFFLVLVLALVGAAVGFGVFASATLPDGPSELVWDREACAFCSMHVGEPPFAAQLQTKDGRTLAFDDPGCLFAMLEREPPAVHAIWFRHHREDRWIAGERVAFAEVSPTPMGYGLGAVDAGTKDSMPLAAARERVLRRSGR